MSRVLNVAVVGFGYMGKMHSMCYTNIPYYYKTDVVPHLYAVVSGKSPEEIPVRFDRYYKTYEEMLKDDDVDIVDICSPNYLHADILKGAVSHNKYIYCEKPLTADLAAAEDVMKTVRETGYSRTSRMAFEYRFVPAIIRAKQIIEEGGIGNIINFNFRYYGCEFLDPERPISWQSTRSLSGGGVLYAMGTHSIDLIRFLIGDVKDVFAREKTHFKTRPVKNHPGERKDVDIEDVINIEMTCGSDIMGTLLLSQVAAGSGIDFTFEIYGEKGSLKFDHSNANVIYYYNNEDPKDPVGGFGGYKAIETTQKYGGEAVFPPPRVTISWPRYHIASIYEFLHAIEEGKTASPDIYDGYQVAKITDAIYRSAETGRIIEVQETAGFF